MRYLALAILAVLVAGCSRQPGTTTVTQAPARWVKAAEWEGTAAVTSEPVHLEGEWKVMWATTPIPPLVKGELGMFPLIISWQHPGDEQVSDMCTDQVYGTSGESYQTEPGTYQFVIVSPGQAYRVEVWQKTQ